MFSFLVYQSLCIHQAFYLCIFLLHIMVQFALSPILLASVALAMSRRVAFTLQNGRDALAHPAKFSGLTADSTCPAGEEACFNDDFAQCVNGKFVTTPCGSPLVCHVLPLVSSPGTLITCDTTGAMSFRRRNVAEYRRSCLCRGCYSEDRYHRSHEARYPC